MRICGFEVDEVLELFDWCRLHCEETEACEQLVAAPILSGTRLLLTSLTLHLKALDGWGSQTVRPKIFADIGRV
jgi:hypothetical protein